MQAQDDSYSDSLDDQPLPIQALDLLHKALGVLHRAALAFVRVLLAALELLGVRASVELSLPAVGRFAWVCACPSSRRLPTDASPPTEASPLTPHEPPAVKGG